MITFKADMESNDSEISEVDEIPLGTEGFEISFDDDLLEDDSAYSDEK